MDILNGYFLKKMTRQFGMYTYRIRGKRGPFKIILPDSFCSFLTPPGMSGSPPSFSDYLYFYSFMNRKIHAHFHWQPISIVRYCSFSFFREDYAETVIVLFLIFRIGLFNNICPYCLPVCPPARRHFSDPLWGHFLFSGITNQVCRPFSRILRDRNGTYSWKFAPAISPVSLQAPQGRNTPPSVCHISSVSISVPHGFPSL